MELVLGQETPAQLDAFRQYEHKDPYVTNVGRVIRSYTLGVTWDIIGDPDQHGFIPIKMRKNGEIRYIKDGALDRYVVIETYRKVI